MPNHQKNIDKNISDNIRKIEDVADNLLGQMSKANQQLREQNNSDEKYIKYVQKKR